LSAARPLRPKTNSPDVGRFPSTDRTLLEAVFALLRQVDRKLDALLEQGKMPRGAAYLPELVEALEQAFGRGSFTTSSILAAVDEPGAGVLFDALLDAGLDLQAPRHAQAVALGMLLRRLDGVELARKARGVRIYRLRD